MEDLNTKFY